MKVKELPISERPYEKLEMYGPENLSNSELLAIIIKTGTKKDTAVTLAQKVLELRKRRGTKTVAKYITKRINENSWDWKSKSNTIKSSM